MSMDVRYAGRYGGGGGGCVARYFGGGLYDVAMVERMMLKFRPIAPKPVASGSGSGDSTVDNGGKSDGGKRKYVRLNGNRKDNKKRKVSTSSFQPREAVSGTDRDAVVTLSLMPETPDRKENSPGISSSSESLDNLPAEKSSSPIWLSFNNNNQPSRDRHVKIITPPERQRQTVLSSVKVEAVAERTCVDNWWMEMESDTCPGFISDREDKVVWANKAYREMMGGGEEVVVVLVRKEMVVFPAAFTCNVRVTCGSGGNYSTLTVPCDAWRMEGCGGGYAWRLDVKAALSLGRYK